MALVAKLAFLSALITVTTAFNSNRRNGENDDIEDSDKQLTNNLNRWVIVIQSLIPETSTPPSEITEPAEDVNTEETEEDPDPLSVVWYLGAFGGLIAFFLVVTFSEWCCASKHLYRRQALQGPYVNNYEGNCPPQTPPPPYHLFAPPPYEVVSSDKTQFPILIIPVHKANSQAEA